MRSCSRDARFAAPEEHQRGGKAREPLKFYTCSCSRDVCFAAPEEDRRGEQGPRALKVLHALPLAGRAFCHTRGALERGRARVPLKFFMRSRSRDTCVAAPEKHRRGGRA
ncbi:hypothetical protein NDU88_007717 [Pleurodeles waltl]|uniref:Uncharacterized protein n=1 Tax=Pleurodeles waltl TaxID=8319 RepID=A0AAV7NU35_PLEWA|nr:hypothetical protein NDU88_007717 [Pleurodeles waltl]